MCGIAGILSRDPINPELIGSMIASLHHRGPDHRDDYTHGPISLGYVRLSILDLSSSANQPMTDESGNFVCVYNGEVYNFQELRNELQQRGVCFRSNCDTEVVVNLFAKEGVAGIRKLNGMFAFAVWSKKDHQLWVFRDPIGVKPLYYQFVNGRLLFASEMKAILAVLDSAPAIAPLGLLNFLTYGHAVAPATIFESIAKLLPGTFIHARPGRMTVDRYFEYPQPEPEHKRSRRPEREWIEEADTCLSAAVRRQKIADVPVGVFLSGGIDSGLITAYMARLGSNLQTFTITFPGRPTYDEAAGARTIARAFNTRHHEIALDDTDLLSAVDTLVYHYDEPFGDAAGIPVYLLSKAARSHVKVVLSGEGGDEVFSGYRRYVAEQVHGLYSLLPHSLKRLAVGIAKTRGNARRFNRIVNTLPVSDPAERYAGWLRVFDRNVLKLLLSDSFAPELDKYDGVAIYRDLFRQCSTSERLSQLSYVDAQTWLPDTYLEKVDKATMATSLEARVPFLDLDVIRFAARVPARLRIRGTTTKYLLRKLASSILPPSIAKQPKHGLSVPTAEWFRRPLLGYVREILLDSRTRRRGLFRSAAVEALIERHRTRQENCETQLWLLLVLELWMRNVLDRVNAPRPSLVVGG